MEKKIDQIKEEEQIASKKGQSFLVSENDDLQKNKTEDFKLDSNKNEQAQKKFNEQKSEDAENQEKNIETEETTLQNKVEIQKDIEDQQLTEANQAVTAQKSKKKKLLTLVFFLINIAVVGYIIVKQIVSGEISSLGEIVAGGTTNWNYLWLVVLCWIVFSLLDALRTNMLIKKSTGRSRFTLAYKMCGIGKYYDNITPMATGGQAFEVFYLTNRGVSGSSSISVPVARYVLEQLSWLILSGAAILISIFHFGANNIISVASYVGFALNLIIVSVTLIISVNEKIGKTLVVKVLKLLRKFKIIKNYEKIYDSVMRTVNNFQTTMKKYASNIKEFLLMMVIDISKGIIIYGSNIFILLMLGGTLTFEIALQLIVYTILISLASGFIPLPGGTGVSELSFTAIFKNVFPMGTVGWAMLFNRFINYYSFLLQGVVILIYDYVLGNKKYLWQKRKWELESESSKFKAEQIKKFKKKNKDTIFF